MEIPLRTKTLWLSKERRDSVDDLLRNTSDEWLPGSVNSSFNGSANNSPSSNNYSHSFNESFYKGDGIPLYLANEDIKSKADLILWDAESDGDETELQALSTSFDGQKTRDNNIRNITEVVERPTQVERLNEIKDDTANRRRAHSSPEAAKKKESKEKKNKPTSPKNVSPRLLINTVGQKLFKEKKPINNEDKKLMSNETTPMVVSLPFNITTFTTNANFPIARSASVNSNCSNGSDSDYPTVAPGSPNMTKNIQETPRQIEIGNLGMFPPQKEGSNSTQAKVPPLKLTEMSSPRIPHSARNTQRLETIITPRDKDARSSREFINRTSRLTSRISRTLEDETNSSYIKFSRRV